jgi:O-acetyl-ADP-ribose deacetylase (regulator of RNase III)
MPTETKIGKTALRLVTGDLAEQDTDAVVTAAHWRLNKGTGTDGTIHSKGGPKIYEECRKIGGCPIGGRGHHHGRQSQGALRDPRCRRGGDEDEPKLLASAYRRSLRVAVQNNLRSVSFPSFSTGAFAYPVNLAAPLALRTIVEFLRLGEHNLDEVRIVLYPREDDTAYPLFAVALEQILAERPAGGRV